MNNQLFEGAAVTIRGQEFIVPGLSFGQMEDMADILTRMSLSGGDIQLTKETIGDVISLIYAALSRNYPELTKAHVRDMVDTRNFVSLIEIIMNKSGLEKVAGAAAGEAKPVA